MKQVKRAHEAARVVAEVTTLGKLEDTLKQIVQGAKDVLGCDIVTLYTFNEKTQSFVHVDGIGYREKSNMRSPQDVVHDSALWHVIELGEPYYHSSENVSEDKLLQGGFVRNEKVNSALGIQLRFEGERVGVLFINYCTSHRFKQDEINDALQLGNQAAVAIHNEHLHETTKRLAEALEGLYKAGTEVTGLQSLNEILESIAEQAWHLVGKRASYTSIWLVEHELAKVVAAYPPEELAQTRATVPEIDLTIGINGRFGVSGRAIKAGSSQLVDDVESNGDYLPSHPQTRSELAVPIQLGELTIGVINVESSEPRAFSEDDNTH